MVKKVLLLVASVSLLLLMASAQPCAAQVFETGDVFAAVNDGKVDWYRGDGSFVQQLDTTRGGFTTGMAFDDSGRLYVTNFSDASVSRFNNDGGLESDVFVNAASFGGAQTESIVFNAAGEFYVGNAGGNADIMKFQADGTYIEQYNVDIESRGSDWMDLAADQSTMFYTSEGFQVKRYDVANDVQLGDFATLGDRPSYALRLLDDGGLLVANDVEVKRLNAAGTTIQTYDVAGNDEWFALNLDPDGTSFWSGDATTGLLHKFDIETGSLLQTIDTGVGSGNFFGVTIFGEITIGNPDPIPEASTIAVWSIVLGICGIGGHWRRRRKNLV